MNELETLLAQVAHLAEQVNALRVEGKEIPEWLGCELCEMADKAKLLAEDYEPIEWDSYNRFRTA
jgi:hypothetical protein